jgi:hypothetical protein
MSPTGHADAASSILRSLEAVEQERARRAADRTLLERVQAVKAFQERRFRDTYADLLASDRYAPAARFFLGELYGPQDFSQRDAQFARIVPALGRLFPHEIVATVATMGALHALSESLDTAMAVALPTAAVDADGYRAAWRRVGRADDRERQIALTIDVGESIDRYTRVPMVSMSLRMMRGPARAAGLSALQSFLEAGFESFRAMRGAGEFLQTVGERERAFAAGLFGASGDAAAAASGQLP